MSIKIIRNHQPAKYHRYPPKTSWKNAYPVICDVGNIIHCRIGGMTFRQMESVLGIPKSTCHRLWWKQLMAVNQQRDVEALARRLIAMKSLEVERREIDRVCQLSVIYPRPRFSRHRHYQDIKERKKKLEEYEASFNCGPAGKYRVDFRKVRPYKYSLQLCERGQNIGDESHKQNRVYTVRWSDLFPRHRR